MEASGPFRWAVAGMPRKRRVDSWHTVWGRRDSCLVGGRGAALLIGSTRPWRHSCSPLQPWPSNSPKGSSGSPGNGWSHRPWWGLTRFDVTRSWKDSRRWSRTWQEQVSLAKILTWLIDNTLCNTLLTQWLILTIFYIILQWFGENTVKGAEYELWKKASSQEKKIFLVWYYIKNGRH